MEQNWGRSSPSPPSLTDPPGFANALGQSILGGDTMVFNRPGRAARPGQRHRQLKDSGLYREGRGQQLALSLATLMKQV
ncbi:MAG: hypothetical protein LBP55_05425 [Candidatus Adiutrix sp.]|nr:hypothetical protein [Candidatus Adiutrix sp.]